MGQPVAVDRLIHIPDLRRRLLAVCDINPITAFIALHNRRHNAVARYGVAVILHGNTGSAFPHAPHRKAFPVPPPACKCVRLSPRFPGAGPPPLLDKIVSTPPTVSDALSAAVSVTARASLLSDEAAVSADACPPLLSDETAVSDCPPLPSALPAFPASAVPSVSDDVSAAPCLLQITPIKSPPALDRQVPVKSVTRRNHGDTGSGKCLPAVSIPIKFCGRIFIGTGRSLSPAK